MASSMRSWRLTPSCSTPPPSTRSTTRPIGCDGFYSPGRPSCSDSGNRALTGLTNLLYGSSLTDMETCYKLIRRDVLEEIGITCNRFDVEPEITAKLLMRGVTIHEVPISYSGRSFAEGKKISWVDFLSAVWTLVRLRISRQA